MAVDNIARGMAASALKNQGGGGVTKASELENDVPFVSATEQSLTEEQKAQARENIGVENVLESVGGDTLTWDGNMEGLKTLDIGTGSTYYKVSDATPSLEELQTSLCEDSSGDVDGAEETVVADTLFLFYKTLGLVCTSDTTIGGVTIPKGVYFTFDTETGVYITSLTIPGYTGFAKKQIKTEYIPESVPNIQTAAVGQTIVVSEVDENGKPTEWEAADMGVADTWEVIYNGEITEDVKSIIVDKDSNGEPFSLKDYKLMIKTVAATESPNSNYSWFWHNNGPGEKGPFYTIYNATGGKTLVFSGKLCENCWYCQYISDTGIASSQYMHMRNGLSVDGVGGPSAVPVYKLTLTASTGNTCGAGSKVVLFGVRA